MPTFAAAFRTEIRRLAAREVRRALSPLTRLQGRVKALRVSSRGHHADVARIERGLRRLKDRLAARDARGKAPRGPRTPPRVVRAMRSRLGMTRVEFARLLGVSPGSIFGWETGRTVPRGPSRARLAELRKKKAPRRKRAHSARKRAARRPRRVGRRARPRG
jgi:DNA-binding transcriptional regulator YiaG